MDRDRGPRTAIDRTGGHERVRIPRIEAYETGLETVIFDGENPLAWIASPAAIPLDQQA